MNKKLRLAFAGFRHGHIFDLLDRARAHAGIDVVAMAEENYDASLMPGKKLTPTHTDIARMLAEVPCDAVAVGDCYGRRARIVTAALRAGKHVISDKPLCISLADLDEIAGLAKPSGPRVGLMFDLRDAGTIRGLREVVRSGRIGVPQTVCISAQHPLIPGTRPAWYFEPGMHGGTLNDIAIHAADIVPWLTGQPIAEITAARAWNAKARDFPHFKDCAQFQLRLANGGGVIGDVSYLAPDRCGFKTDNYWRITVHGTAGFAETSYGGDSVRVADDAASDLETLPAAAKRPGGYLEDFLADVAGSPAPDGLSTAAAFTASRWALELQRIADAEKK